MDKQRFLKAILECKETISEYLYFEKAHLSEIPPEIAELTWLKELNLYNNDLSTLPPTIGELKSLRTLELSFNKLTKLPEEIGNLRELETLSLALNSITELPCSVKELRKLKRLDLIGNPIRIPPEILERIFEPDIILNYYFEHVAGPRRSLNEAKVLLVGQGSVGKTSLVKRLVDNGYDPDQSKTQGISIRKWEIQRRKTITDGIVLNVWDFGGQEIMHATHQFFLTKRSLYLLVLDSRIGQEENRVEYWLKLIQSFGGDSPVIIVGNKVDQHPLDIDRSGLKKKYKNIKGFVETSCADGRGIEELRSAVIADVVELPHIHDQLLLTWFAVKQKLEQLGRDYIPYIDYVAMCKAEGISAEISQRTLIGFLHDLGVVLNFHDDPRLEDTNILNPEWVTDGVYRILNSNMLFQNKGVLLAEDLDKVLDLTKYPRNKHMFIIDMMKKFELCYEFEGSQKNRYLVPDLLPKDEKYTGPWNDALSFQFLYNVLPSSIISRFIVRTNPNIHQNTVWRSGVLLEYGENLALVKADYEERKIFIFVNGRESTRRDVLSAIRFELQSIHKTIPGLDTKEKVPLPNDPTLPPVDYYYLLKLENHDIATFMPEGMIEPISVQSLLNGIEDKNDRGRTYRRILILQERSSVLSSTQQLATNEKPPEMLFSQRAPRLARSRRANWKQALVGFFTLPKYIGRFILEVLGRQTISNSTSITLGYIIIIVVLLLLWGILDVNTLKEAYRFFFPEPK